MALSVVVLVEKYPGVAVEHAQGISLLSRRRGDE
jgi:hypothetical protein